MLDATECHTSDKERYKAIKENSFKQVNKCPILCDTECYTKTAQYNYKA